MNKSPLLEMFSELNSMHNKSKEEKKLICEDLIQEAINQIKKFNRNATEWETAALMSAISQILWGRYFLSLKEVEMSTKKSTEVAKPEHWWNEVDDINLDKLQSALNLVKSMPIH